MIVMKFGGTSLASAERYARAVDLAKARGAAGVLVVVSATAGTTNTLIAAAETASRSDSLEAKALLSDLERKHREILLALGAEDAPEAEFESTFSRLQSLLQSVILQRELTARSLDVIVGYGERLSALLFTAAARAKGVDVAFVDAASVVTTDARFGAARPDAAATETNAREKLLPVLEERIVVTQGFVGSTPAGEPTTLGRGGSDYTASLLGAALSAEEIQIWTDVPGMLTADHRIVPEGLAIRELSFREAAELAYFGAKVLHPATIEPALARNIPVRILESSRPQERGTWITASPRKTGPPVKSIASKRGITVVHVRSLRMLMAHGFLNAIFEVFDRFEIAIDLVTTSEVSVSLTLDDDRRLAEAVAALSAFGEVRVASERAIVCLVGEGLSESPGVAARALGALGNIRVEMLSQGASEINLSLVVAAANAEEAVRRLHHEFFADVVDDLFEPARMGEVS